MKTILILAVNPINTNSLRLDEEVREIDSVLRRAKRRDEFALKQQWAVRSRDVQAALLDFNPQIVHFSGHGTGVRGLAFEDEAGQAKLVTTEALSALFKLFSAQVECVILNACYADVQAKAIAQQINHVIGMNQPIGDRAAIEFAVGFYTALGAGRFYEDAFEFGCNNIQLAGIPEFQTPVLLTNPNLLSSSTPSPSTPQPNLRREKLQELKEEYDFLSEKLQSLRRSLRIDDLTPGQRFQVKKQIEDAESQREQLIVIISRLETAI